MSNSQYNPKLYLAPRASESLNEFSFTAESRVRLAQPRKKRNLILIHWSPHSHFQGFIWRISNIFLANRTRCAQQNQHHVGLPIFGRAGGGIGCISPRRIRYLTPTLFTVWNKQTNKPSLYSSYLVALWWFESGNHQPNWGCTIQDLSGNHRHPILRHARV